MEKPGVVIFNSDYFTDEGLAALRWASSVFPKLTEKSLVHILLVDEMNGERKASFGEDKGMEGLAGMVDTIATKKFGKKDKDKAIATFDKYKKYFDDVPVEVRICKGDNIQGILEGAIEKFKLDTLVLGMAAALGSTCKNGHLQLNSKCSVMLVNMEGSKPLTTKFEIIPPPKGQTTKATTSSTKTPGLN